MSSFLGNKKSQQLCWFYGNKSLDYSERIVVLNPKDGKGKTNLLSFHMRSQGIGISVLLLLLQHFSSCHSGKNPFSYLSNISIIKYVI